MAHGAASSNRHGGIDVGQLQDIGRWRGSTGLTLLSAIVDSSDDAIVGKTVDGLITSWNTGAQRMYGYTADEVLGQPITILSPADRVDETTEILGKIRRGERVLQLETVRKRKDGTTLPVSVTVSPVRDEEGTLIGVSSIARDNTEQHRSVAELRRRADELERVNRNLEAFSYSVAHDLRAPLRALGGYSAALLDEYWDALGEAGQDYAKRIQAASEQMATLIDDLLHLSRVSRADINAEAVDLGAEVDSIAEELQRQEPGRRVRFVVQRPVWAMADRLLIRTVLQNLLGNAWKFTSGRDEASIEFGSAPVGVGDAGICYYVRDNGAGFDSAYAEKLFKPFQRLHPKRDFPGTGVGLASVQHIVEKHGGRTWAEGAVDHGSTFYFTLSPKGAA
jgi:PAS domain S-box-containing protein